MDRCGGKSKIEQLSRSKQFLTHAHTCRSQKMVVYMQNILKDNVLSSPSKFKGLCQAHSKIKCVNQLSTTGLDLVDEWMSRISDSPLASRARTHALLNRAEPAAQKPFLVEKIWVCIPIGRIPINGFWSISLLPGGLWEVSLI